MKATILGGLLFLVPLAFLAIVLGKAFQISMVIAKPIDAVMPIQSLARIAFINIVAVLLIVLVCFLASLAARYGWLGSRWTNLTVCLSMQSPDMRWPRA